LAFEGDVAVGIACMQRIGPETAEIKRMYVDPLHRRGGLGRAMLAQLITDAKITGYERSVSTARLHDRSPQDVPRQRFHRHRVVPGKRDPR
jgi:GNAT superfamily N-acetyltransferase